MSRIKDKISAIVSSQLPEFIQADYTTFVAFIEAYYRFLEQDQYALELVQNARSYNDIDTTAASFVQYFLKTYAKDIPSSLLADKTLLIKRISDLYQAKGSDLSFQVLFSILYNTTVSVKHPYDYVLRASDGIWDQGVSLRVRKTSGSVTDIQNRYLTVVKNNITYDIPITRVKELETNLYEIFIKSGVLPSYVAGDIVTVSSADEELFRGAVENTTASYTINTPGQGFKVGQIITVNLEGGVETRIKITKITATGGISRVSFINFGYNYTNDFTVNVYPDSTVAARTSDFTTKTNSVRDSGTILSPHGAGTGGRYFDTEYAEYSGYYTGNLITSFSYSPAGTGSTTTSIVGDTDATVAVIAFKLGAIARYPGQYISNKGFSSEPDVRLQDDALYQPFAYQLETEVDFSSFYNTVTSLLHPSGTNMFNNRLITNTANVYGNVSVISTANIFTSIFDSYSAEDSTALEFILGNVNNTVSLSDNKTISSQLVKTDSVTESDSSLIQISKAISDSTIAVENQSLNIDKLLADTVTILETASYQLNRTINNTDSTVSITDTASLTLLNYAEAGYFAESYAGEAITIT